MHSVYKVLNILYIIYFLLKSHRPSREEVVACHSRSHHRLVHHHPCSTRLSVLSAHLCLLSFLFFLSLPVLSSLTFGHHGWSHPSAHAIGSLQHSQRCDWWSPVPVTYTRALSGAGYHGIKFVKVSADIKQCQEAQKQTNLQQ